MVAIETTPDKPLRIVFAGTPEFARQHLQLLVESGKTIVGVYTQPDRAAGRGKKTRATPVKQYAVEHQLPVFQPSSLKPAEARAELVSLAADVMVVVAYGLLLPSTILDVPALGCINVHASLLPRWRGAAPIERAIAAGDPESGVTIMQMDVGLDTGPMLCQRICPIDAVTTGDSLRQKLAQLGGEALLETLAQLEQGTSCAEAQDDTLSCYAPKLDKQEAWIDWSQPATAIARQIRAFCSANVATSLVAGERVKIWLASAIDTPHTKTAGTILGASKAGIEVACGSGRILISRLQMPGGIPLTAEAILNGRPAAFAPGTRFGDAKA
jgi:methionyl-tRNA formyltransferase